MSSMTDHGAATRAEAPMSRAEFARWLTVPGGHMRIVDEPVWSRADAPAAVRAASGAQALYALDGQWPDRALVAELADVDPQTAGAGITEAQAELEDAEIEDDEEIA